ncbi:MAG: helix-turn-helix domain-containing protein [Hyphomonadaceae bacterium]
MANSLHDHRYKRLIELVVEARLDAELTQRDVAKRLRVPPSYIAKVETLQRRIDFVELVDLLTALRVNVTHFLRTALQELHRR